MAVMIIDGGIRSPHMPQSDGPDKLEPDDIALAAHYLTTQPQSAWSFEVDVRPMLEKW